jgi:hypothetical protein
MKKNFLLFFCVIAFLMVAPHFAQDNSDQCTPAGTWWGGSSNPANAGFKYMMTIFPSGEGKYVVFIQAAYSLETIGEPVQMAWTGELVIGEPVQMAWTGELVKIKQNQEVYEIRAMSLTNSDAGFPPNALPYIYAIRGTIKIRNCNTIKVTIDFFGFYQWGKEPFIDAPDMAFPTPIKETYTRMSWDPFS